MSNKQVYILGNQDVDTSFLTLEMTWLGMQDPRITGQAGVAHPDMFAEIVNGTTINAFINGQEAEQFVPSCANRLLSNPELVADLKTNTIRLCQAMREMAFEYIDRVGELSQEEMIEFLEKARALQAETVSYGTVVAWADVFGGITQRLIEIINQYDDLKHQRHVYSNILGGPEEKSLTEQAYADIMNSTDTDRLLKEYFWLDQGYIGRGITGNQIKHIQHDHTIEESSITAEELLAEISLTDEELQKFSVSRDVIFMKSLRADSRQFLNVVTNNIVDRLAIELKTEARLLETLAATELITVLRSNVVPDSLEQRWQHAVAVAQGSGEYEMLLESTASEYLQERLKVEEAQQQDVIEGQVAQGGIVRGTVKLVFGPQHLSKVNTDDILVSTATSPQLLPAMKRAAAFITDVGGVTSHAAIVSRELKKPCIVGTRIATQILRDGDEVEVDADNGVVKILKKNT